jgi:hypothetical protein
VGRRKKVDPARVREAEEYLTGYLAGAEPRLRWLREWASQSNGPTPDQLDLSRDSLVPLWAWAIVQFELRPEDAALERVERDPHRYYLPVGAQLPMWFGRLGITAPHWWSDRTLELIDAIAYYFAESLRRAVPSAQWTVGHADVPNYVHEGQPVLTGFETPLNPLLPVLNLAGRVYRLIRHDSPNPYDIPTATLTDLQAVFDGLLPEVE